MLRVTRVPAAVPAPPRGWRDDLLADRVRVRLPADPVTPGRIDADAVFCARSAGRCSDFTVEMIGNESPTTPLSE